MPANELFLRQCWRDAREDPARVLVQLWNHLKDQQNFNEGFEPWCCEEQAEEAFLALQTDRNLPDVPAAALLRSVDRYLAEEDGSTEPRSRWIEIAERPSETFAVLPRRRGWTSVFAVSQPSQPEYWMRLYQVVPRRYNGISIDIWRPPEPLLRGLEHPELPFAAGGFVDGVGPDWYETFPYRCRALQAPELRWQSLLTLLEEADRLGTVLLVLPELTVDLEVRSRLRDWLWHHRRKHPFRLVVAGSFHEADPGLPDDPGSRRNVVLLYDRYGKEILRQAKIQPMYTTKNGKKIYEGVKAGLSICLVHASFGLAGLAVCRDFCEEGGRVEGLWEQVGPALMLVPSMGSDSTNRSHGRKARKLARSHGTRTLVASQHDLDAVATGFYWNGPEKLAQASPVLYGAIHWIDG